MRRHAKLLIASTVGLFVAATATASVPNKTVEIVDIPDAVETTQSHVISSDRSKWNVQRSLDTLGISIDLNEADEMKVEKQVTATQNLFFCAGEAESKCKFILLGHPGLRDTYNACYTHHFQTCLTGLGRINEGIGGE